MHYDDYIGNVARLAVELANADGPTVLSEESRRLLEEHDVHLPAPADLADLPALVRAALAQIVDGSDPSAVHALLDQYPPDMHLSDHDGRLHVHYARNGSPPRPWLGRLTAAQLALLVMGDTTVTLGRCAAANCANFFVDQSRNRTRRFCGNACASRTTVAAYRARSARG